MIYVREGNIPKKWYNIVPDLPYFPPYKLPNGEEVREEHLYRIFPRECVRQEFSKERYTDIPEDLMEAYERIGRPTPLYRARRLEKALKTPARIYYKREDLSPTGSHKTNTAIAQAYYAMKEGVKRLTTETGAGQWGSALAYSTAMMGIKALIFMVRVSYNQKPYRKYVMKMYGADVVPSPSELTEFGRRLLKENPDHPGSLGVAISEALEAALSDENTKYSLGSVLNHVLIHQSIIGQEAMEQLSSIGEKPDVLVGCVGGGSNFAGLTYPFIGRMLRKECEKMDVIAVEPTEVPSMTKGEYRYDHADTAAMTPLLKMFTLGYNFVPPPIYAGGLRYHGLAPSLSVLVKEGIVKPVAIDQKESFSAAKLFAETEGLIPAPETSHAIAAVIRRAVEDREKGEEEVILFNYSGHGLLDLEGYRVVLSL